MEDQRAETANLPDEHAERPKAEREEREEREDRERWERWLEVLTAIMLGVVAVATAWSGYQSTRWSGVQAALYSEASALRVESTRASDQAGDDRLYDVNLFDAWLTAQSEGNVALANIFERRFRPEFVPAFLAWTATDPLHNPHAPPGPLFMAQYQLSQAKRADQLQAQASRTFRQGEDANQRSDDYVLNTVFLAVVLFLTAIAERFEWRPVRIGVLILAGALLVFGIYHLVVYPIA